MEIKPEHQQRLDEALEAADLAYWAVVAAKFPEAKTGDYPPDLTFSRDAHNKEDLLWWLRFNAPELMVGYEEEQAPRRYNMYCPSCQEWVMAEESIGEWHETPSGAGKLVYTCPLCHQRIIPSWEGGA